MNLFVLLAMFSFVTSAQSIFTKTEIGKATASQIVPFADACENESKVFKFTTSGSRNDFASIMFELKNKTRSFNDIKSIDFSWCRPVDLNWENSTLSDGTYIQDWRYKSPFVRIHLSDGTQLVWEAYYNHMRTPVSQLVDNWISENALSGRWWAHRNGVYTTGKKCQMKPMKVWSGKARALSYEKIRECFGSFKVTSFSMGVGNQWPLSYRAYAKSLKFSFKE